MSYQRANGQTDSIVIADAIELGNFLDVHQRPGLQKPLLHEYGQMRATGKHLGFTAMLLEQRAGLGDGFGFQVIEVLHD